jgi:hypothetical protein
MFFLDAEKQYTGTWATVWGVEEKNGFTKSRISTSEKDQEGNYKNSDWFATFGKNVSEKAKTLQKGDRIIIKKGKITNRTEKKPDGTFVSYLNVDIYYFVLPEDNGGSYSAPSESTRTKFPKPKPPIKETKEKEQDDSLPFDL